MGAHPTAADPAHRVRICEARVVRMQAAVDKIDGAPDCDRGRLFKAYQKLAHAQAALSSAKGEERAARAMGEKRVARRVTRSPDF